MMDLYSLLKPVLFRLDAEKAHHLTLETLKYLPSFLFQQNIETKPVKALNLSFPHAIGLAAGLDKNGEYLNALAKIGFSFIELGTVTPLPQVGNPKPRLFRIPEHEAIINRMGFNNLGVDALVENIKKSEYKGILGINIGKNRVTSLQDAAKDYCHCLKKVYSEASYITINISSPNTADLRLLQQEEFFNDLLGALIEEQQRQADIYQKLVPLVVKLSPDETDESLKRMANSLVEKKIAGIIATNTTVNHESVRHAKQGQEEGGLSGSPLKSRSTGVLSLLKKEVGDELSLIGVGGIDGPSIAKEKINAGASLLQVYTGLIYKGPELIRELVAAL